MAGSQRAGLVVEVAHPRPEGVVGDRAGFEGHHAAPDGGFGPFRLGLGGEDLVALHTHRGGRLLGLGGEGAFDQLGVFADVEEGVGAEVLADTGGLAVALAGEAHVLVAR